MWSIAVKTLISDRGKLLTALVGVIFSVVLVNVQGGLFLGLIQKAGLLVDHGQADIWVGHHRMHNIDFPRDIPRRWVYRIKPIPGVAEASPYLVGHSQMTLPSGGYEGVVVVGVDRGSMLGNAWNLSDGSSPHLLFTTDGVIVDHSENEKLESPALGEVREIGGRRARIAAKSDGITGFLVNPYIFTTYDRAVEYLQKDPQYCSYFLVSLEPGADRAQVCQAIRKRIPEVEAYPRDQFSEISVSYWMTRTGLGISFGAATILGLLVGLVMVAQTLYAMVLDRLAEFGAMKAIGAAEWQIQSIVIIQSLFMALTGSVIGLAVVATVRRFASTPKAPIVVPLELGLGSCLLVLLVCLAASLWPYLRVRKVDPLMVLQS